MYYLRTQAAAQAVQFSLEKKVEPENSPETLSTEESLQPEYAEGATCTFDDEGNCISCSA
jgi:ribonucleoside-diphosphate reductase alpha chain